MDTTLETEYLQFNAILATTRSLWQKLRVYDYLCGRRILLLLVFRKKDLYLIITQKLTFMKSGGFQVKSTQNLIKSDVSTKTLQFGGCMEGAMTPDFMKSRVIAPLLHSSNWIVLVETFAFIRFWVDFTWNLPDFTLNPPDFMRISWNPKFHVKKDHLQGIVTL